MPLKSIARCVDFHIVAIDIYSDYLYLNSWWFYTDCFLLPAGYRSIISFVFPRSKNNFPPSRSFGGGVVQYTVKMKLII